MIHPSRIVKKYLCEHWHTHELDWRTHDMMGVRVCKHCATPMPLDRPTVGSTHPDSGD